MISTQKFTLSIVLALVLGFALGFVAERSSAEKVKENYKEELQARMTEIGIVPPPASEVFAVTGSIISVDGNVFLMKVSSPRDPFGDPTLDERTVTVDEKTTIEQTALRDYALYEKEMEEYRSKLSKMKPGAAADPNKVLKEPLYYERKTGDITVLKAGQLITVTAVDNVRDKKSFSASTINISGEEGATPETP